MNERRGRMASMRGLPKLVVGLAAALAGCAAGPDYVRPAAPQQARYTPLDPAVVAGGKGVPGQTIRHGAEVPQRWWQAFGSPALDALVEQALAASPTLASARAAVAQADALLAAERGGAYPQLDVAASAARIHAGGAGADRSTASQFALGPELGFDPDLFGGIRRRVEQAQALADYQQAQWQSAQLDLVGSLVLQAIALASLQEQIAAASDIVDVDRRNLALVQVSATAGKSARLDVLTAQSQLASDLALIPPLEQQASVARHALALLSGRSPADWLPPAFRLTAFTLPRQLPLTLPSLLVRGHPGVRGAEAQLHAANAAIGIASAQLYPNMTLSASWSARSSTVGGLFDGGSHPWSLAADLLAPVFHGGTLVAQRDAAVAAYAVQLGNYREAVLRVFSGVADALEALPHDAAASMAQADALRSARAVLALTQESYQAGQASLLQLLVAQRLYQQARLGYARAQGQRFSDTAQLFIALGGAPGPG